MMDFNAEVQRLMKPPSVIRQHQLQLESIAQGVEVFIAIDRGAYKAILEDMKKDLNGIKPIDVPYKACDSDYRYEAIKRVHGDYIAIFAYYANNPNHLSLAIYWDTKDHRPIVIHYNPEASKWDDIGSILYMERDVLNYSKRHSDAVGKCLQFEKQQKEKKELERKREEELYKYRIFRVQLRFKNYKNSNELPLTPFRRWF